MRMMDLHTEKGQERFGRIPHFDPRDKQYAAAIMVEALTETQTLPAYKYYQATCIDQGYTPQCVAYSCGGLIEAGPVRQNIFDEKDPGSYMAYLEELYIQAQELDEWPGDDYDGTSVRAGMKALQARNLIQSYEWAWDVRTIDEWVRGVGPVVMGTDWFEGMMGDSTYNRKTRFLDPSGRVVGGHAWLVIGSNTEKKCPDGSRGAFRMVNSWGRSWMDNGRAWISFAAMDRLMDQWAEASMSREIRGVATEHP